MEIREEKLPASRDAKRERDERVYREPRLLILAQSSDTHLSCSELINNNAISRAGQGYMLSRGSNDSAILYARCFFIFINLFNRILLRAHMQHRDFVRVLLRLAD